MSNETDRFVISEPRPVPALGSLGLGMMALLLMLIAFVMVRKRTHG